MSVELSNIQFMFLVFGIVLWVGGWWAVRDFCRHMNMRFDQLDEGFRRFADEIRKLTHELAEFRGEMRARLDGRASNHAQGER